MNNPLKSNNDSMLLFFLVSFFIEDNFAIAIIKCANRNTTDPKTDFNAEADIHKHISLGVVGNARHKHISFMAYTYWKHIEWFRIFVSCDKIDLLLWAVFCHNAVRYATRPNKRIIEQSGEFIFMLSNVPLLFQL